MSNLNKVTVPTAVVHKTKLDLSCDHVTTMNFGQPRPIYYRHMIAGEKINVNTLSTIRPFPMAVPTYGRMRANIRYFFCPWRLVFPNFSSFYTDVIASNYGTSSLVAHGPEVTNKTLAQWFITGTLFNGPLTVVAPTPTPPAVNSLDNCDLYYGGSYYNFTTLGRYCYNILLSLGYRINWTDKDTHAISALSLLAFARIYVDWYANAQYLDGSDVLRLKQLFAFNTPNSYLNLSTTDLTSLFGYVLFCTYDSDSYFTNAWDNPVSPNSGQYSSITMNDETLPYPSTMNVSLNAGNGTPYMQNSVGSGNATYPVNLGTEYLHTMLKKLTDFQKRHQLTGAREIDRLLGQWGFAPDANKIERSIYINGQSIDVNVGDIMSTADTGNAQLGDYAGRGFGQNKGNIDFTTDEFGLLIGIASILPSGGLYTGADRNNYHLDKYSFFQPEFDGMGCQSIMKREFFVSRDGTFDQNNGADYAKSGGFTGRYGEYKRPISWQSGDIVYPSVMPGGNSWTLMRELKEANFGAQASSIGHSKDFASMSDYAQYNRIFNDTSAETDKFFCCFHFDVAAFSPCKPLFETYEFDELGKEITLQSNGTTLN